MKLLVLGATGPTGRHVVDLATQAGDTVTVLARNPSSLGDLVGRVDVVGGDATAPEDVATAMAGQDVVVSTLGRGRSVRAGALFSRAAEAVVDAAGRTGVSRLVWMSSFGVGETFDSATPAQKFMYRTMLRDLYLDKERAEKKIRGSGLAWTLVYPTALTNGPAKGTYRVDERIAMHGAPRINRADVADFMYKATRMSEWIRRNAVITD